MKSILSVLFDIKPVDRMGNFDFEKIRKIESIINLRNVNIKNKEIDVQEVLTKEKILEELEEIERSDIGLKEIKQSKSEINLDLLEEFYFPEVASKKYFNVSTPRIKQKERHVFFKKLPKSLVGFILIVFAISLIVPGASFISRGMNIKDDVLSSSLSAYQNLLAAQNSLEQADWQTAEQSFGLARSNFADAGYEIRKMGNVVLSILDNLPGNSLVSSGNHLVKVGENLAMAGQTLASAVNLFSFNNLFNLINSKESNLTDNIVLSQVNLKNALQSIEVANKELDDVEINVMPSDMQEGIVSLKDKLPLVEKMLNQALSYSSALLSILGHDNSRQYLLIFQNNSEIRATGGFIGTYGLLTLDRGVISDLFIDGIYNADGQLHEKIIPPRPIQKISTTWSMHDANWFADFPTSAQKIEWFYEKTGGPTVDGVISLTPTLIERLLEITGPISMPDYDVVLDENNFIELVQYKVEIDYDKELNRPKKILADFAPKFIETLSSLSSENKKKAITIIFDCLKEKHILAYFNDQSLEKLSIDEGWSGKILETDKDYLSVVSSNINGYKTDRMVEETISHEAEIQEDGSIVDTLTIKREHKGGDSEYDWWNRVNSNYLRVYLPLGSELISANGQSLEIYQPPIDYQKNNFKKDPLVEEIESKMITDKKTGTRIFEESNKTVFGNWVYVSPGETVILVYKYKLPFKIDLTKPTDSYSLLVQKQLGSIGSNFNHKLEYPEDWKISWRYPEDSNLSSGALNIESDLKIDRFSGATFEF
ncbi:MAG: DUF4012 domain-containing protein [Patescibacteria group bacterium]